MGITKNSKINLYDCILNDQLKDKVIKYTTYTDIGFTIVFTDDTYITICTNTGVIVYNDEIFKL